MSQIWINFHICLSEPSVLLLGSSRWLHPQQRTAEMQELPKLQVMIVYFLNNVMSRYLWYFLNEWLLVIFNWESLLYPFGLGRYPISPFFWSLVCFNMWFVSYRKHIYSQVVKYSNLFLGLWIYNEFYHNIVLSSHNFTFYCSSWLLLFFVNLWGLLFVQFQEMCSFLTLTS